MRKNRLLFGGKEDEGSQTRWKLIFKIFKKMINTKEVRADLFRLKSDMWLIWNNYRSGAYILCLTCLVIENIDENCFKRLVYIQGISYSAYLTDKTYV